MTERMLQRISSALVALTTCALVLFLVIAVTYVLYLFVRATKLTDIAGVHISKSIFLEYKSLKGELYTDQANGIENWIVSEDEVNGFRVKYPNDWQKQEDERGFIFKKSKQGLQKTESLESVIHVEKLEGIDADAVESILIKENLELSDKQKADISNFSDQFRTGKTKAQDGLCKELVFCKSNGNIYVMKVVYYLEDSVEFEKIFNTMVSQFTII